jgi:hypothetical protein
MHNNNHFCNCIVQALGIDYELIHTIYLHGGPVEHIKQQIQEHKDKFVILVGQDRASKFYFLPLDAWSYLDHLDFAPLALDLDYLDPDKLPLTRLRRVFYNQNCMSNLEVLVLHQPMMDITYNQGPWLSLMRWLRPHRKYAFQNYISKLSDSVVFSFGKQNFLGQNPDFDCSDRFYHGPELLNTNNFLSLIPLYNSCGGSIVSETALDRTITEKTFHAIMAGHPVLIIGVKGSIQHLRDHGFDVFDDILDHRYDGFDSIYQRIDRLFHDNAHILSAPLDRSMIADRLEQNRWHLWKYRDRICKQMITDVRKCYR